MSGRGDLNGFLDRGSTFRGELEFEDTMRIDGHFYGSIRSKNELIVGETAVIDAEIHVGRIAISGVVKGKIHAVRKVEIHKGGRVYSDIVTPALVVEEGAILQGACVINQGTVDASIHAAVPGSAPQPVPVPRNSPIGAGQSRKEEPSPEIVK